MKCLTSPELSWTCTVLPFTKGIITSLRMPVLIQKIWHRERVFICCASEIHTPRLTLPRHPEWVILWASAGNHGISFYFTSTNQTPPPPTNIYLDTQTETNRIFQQTVLGCVFLLKSRHSFIDTLRRPEYIFYSIIHEHNGLLLFQCENSTKV